VRTATPEKILVARAFSRKADTYERHAFVQQLCVAKIVKLMTPLPRGENLWLDLGSGTGLLEKIIPPEMLPRRILCLDIAQGFLTRLQEERLEGILPVQADAEALPLSSRAIFDRILMASILQWTATPEEIVRASAAHLNAPGHMVFSILLEDHLKEFMSVKSRMGHPLPVHFPSEGTALSWFESSGLRILQSEVLSGVVHHKSALEVIKSLVAIGATAIKGDPMSVKELFELCREYEREYRTEKGVAASHSVLVGVAVPGASAPV